MAIAIAALLVATLAFYYASTITNTVSAYNVRKEDLQTSQQRIERTLQKLDATLQQELENQQALASKVTELSAKTDLPPPVINTTKVVQDPHVVVTVPRPVSRAS